MSIQHHIGDDTLLAYANGTLSKSLSIVVATHLAICPSCRKSLQMVEAVAGHFVMGQDKAAMEEKDTSLQDAILSGIMAEPEAAPETSNPSTLLVQDMEVPKPLADHLPVPLSEIHWKKLAPGVSHYPLQSDDEKNKGVLRLLKIAPGTSIPEHSHGGQELTLILQGSYIDDLGRFQKGDIADLDDEIHHQPVADTDMDCICLIATDAPLKFSGFFSRLFQPLIGI